LTNYERKTFGKIIARQAKMAENSQLQFIWQKICGKVKGAISIFSYNTFFETLEPIDILNRCIVLKCPSESNAQTITAHHADILKDAIKQADLGISGFKLVVDGSDVYSLESAEEDYSSFQPVPLNKNYTFSSFVVSSSTKLVYAAAKAVAENPGESFNPLFIYGESGLGKTHLMQAIANEIATTHPEKRVLYTTCDNFLNEFIDTMISGKMNSRDRNAQFRAHYRNVDVLMIDDIQFLAKKPGTQEEFFHTFNELFAQNKQIVLTSDKHPKEIATLEERLRTRFEGGLIADVQPPDLETKIAILKQKALERKCPMPDDVLEFLASNSGHDVRTLEGRLTKVIFASRLHEEPITLSLAQLALNESVREETEEKEAVTHKTIIDAVCSYYKQKKEDLLGKGKKADLVKARQVCAYLMCEMLSLPLVSIGNIMGGRDHTTIMYSRDKMQELIKLNDRIAKEVDDIKNIILKQ